MLLHDDTLSVLSASTSMFVAVDSKRGPHVTPDLFVESSGRLWSFTAAKALKVRTLTKKPRCGVLVWNGDDAVVMAATATVVDARDPLGVATSGAALDVPRIAASFASKHAIELAGGAFDLISGRFGTLPGRWVLLSLEVDAVAHVRGNELVHDDGWGAVSSPVVEGGSTDGADTDDLGDETDDDGRTIAVEALPDAVAHLASRERAALGWYTAHGPLALPARWALDTSTATVAARVFDVVGGGSHSPAAVTIDEWVSPGPSGKRGLMLRGQGTASPSEDGVEVAVTAERAVVWDGVETESVAGIRDFADGTGHTATVSDPNKDPKKETRAG
ncbi:MAG TPA: pyridoxamine 5'-phosphate oxidase family protein [Acidimicrobiales bacterium]|nr:pyridoxamine 5'-phosphate oxidase family protein [Acidimicrobiales bacterium]